MKHRTLTLASFLLAILLTACGGSSSDTTTPTTEITQPEPVVSTKQGTFFSGDIVGIAYTSGDISGTVSEDGQFEYEEKDGIAQTVSFSVAGIELGSAVGKSSLSPIDLSQGSSIDSIEVINRISLLKLLSVNPDATVTLKMQESLLSNAETFAWPTPDFSATDFSETVEIVQIEGDINAFLSEQRVIPTPEEASNFLNSRIFCQASGIYYGDIEGGDSGHIIFGLSPIDGTFTTLGWSDGAQNIIFIPQPANPSFESTIQFDSGVSLSGERYIGEVITNNTAEGTWSNSTLQTEGTFVTTNQGRDPASIYHFTAAYLAVFPVFGPGPAGAYSLALKNDGTVTGQQINIAFGDTTSTPITGTWEDNQLTATVEGGATINAFISFETNQIFGEWQDVNAPITSGAVSGTGCQINAL